MTGKYTAEDIKNAKIECGSDNGLYVWRYSNFMIIFDNGDVLKIYDYFSKETIDSTFYFYHLSLNGVEFKPKNKGRGENDESYILQKAAWQEYSRRKNYNI